MASDDSHRSLNASSRRLGFRKAWIAWGMLLLFSAAGWMRAVDAWTDWRWLSLAGTQPGPLYLILSGALWGLVALAGVIGLLLRLKYGRAIALIAAVVLALTFWLDRIFFSHAPGSGGNTPFALLATLVLLGAAAAVLTTPEERQRLFRRG